MGKKALRRLSETFTAPLIQVLSKQPQEKLCQRSAAKEKLGSRKGQKISERGYYLMVPVGSCRDC